MTTSSQEIQINLKPKTGDCAGHEFTAIYGGTPPSQGDLITVHLLPSLRGWKGLPVDAAVRISSVKLRVSESPHGHTVAVWECSGEIEDS